MEIIAPVSLPEVTAAPVSRASSAGTYWDRFGVLKTAAPNTPRITYNPADLSAAPYLLLEPAVTNLVIYSDTLVGAGWGNNLATSSGAADPAGGAAASRWVMSDVGQGPYVSVPGLIAGQTYTASVFFRGSAGALRFGLEQPTQTAIIDTASKTASPYDGGIGSVTKCADGWYRASVTFTVGAASNKIVVLYSLIGPMTVDFYGFQVEAGSVASSYVPTTSAPVTRDADVLTASNGLLWSNVVESDALDGALWNSATAYTVGQVVRRPNHRRYSALKASTNAIPENTATGDAAATWQDIGPTQRFAVFDQKYSTVATNPEVVQYLVKPGTISQAVAALGLDGSDVRVSVVDGNTGALVYQRTNSLRVKNCRSIVEYLTKPISRRADDVFDDLPPFKNALILLTVTKPGSVAKLSDVIVGRVEYAGEMQWKPEIRTLRRSVIKDDGFGNLTFTKRRSSKLISADVTVDSNLVDDTVRVLNGYTDQPCVIIGDKRWTALIILGYVKDFRLVLEYEGQAGAIYNAQIEGFA